MAARQPVSVIIVTHDSAEVISGALSSVADDPLVRECFVVDNASADATCDIVAQRFPDVRLLRNLENLGFGVANNLALARVKTDYALLLNPDARMEKEAVAILLEAAKRYPRAAILAPSLRHEDGRFQESYKRDVFARERGGGTFVPPAGDLSAGYLSGAAWLINIALLRGGFFFDPQFFLFYEDDDLCLRVRQAGCDLALIPDARATHAMGRSSPETERSVAFKQYHMMRSRLLLERKYRGAQAAFRLARRESAKQAGKWLGYALLGRRGKMVRCRARLRAARDCLSGK